ncbi:MAG: 4Fe-4S dicluster domain-containing protein [Bdellovibrionota bacterium]
MKTTEGKETPVVECPQGEKGDIGRRDFMEQLTKTGAGALALGLAGGAAAILATACGTGTVKTSDGKQKYRYGMVIDTRRCVGCEACVVACKAENKTPVGVFNNRVTKDAEAGSPNEKPIFMTRPCFHCENPPCVAACPVEGATYKRESDGIVVVNYDVCGGSQACITACPYGARTFDEGKNYPAVSEKTPYAKVPSPEYNQFRAREGERATSNVARKCTFCMHLQDDKGRYDQAAGRWPACTKTCTGHAIFFGDFNDSDSEVSKLVKAGKAVRLKEHLKTEPNVYYLM